MLHKLAIVATAAVLGSGAAVGVSACGEDRGSVSVEDGGTGTAGTGTSTAPTESTPTETTGTETTETEETQTERKPSGGAGGY